MTHHRRQAETSTGMEGPYTNIGLPNRAGNLNSYLLYLYVHFSGLDTHHLSIVVFASENSQDIFFRFEIFMKTDIALKTFKLLQNFWSGLTLINQDVNTEPLYLHHCTGFLRQRISFKFCLIVIECLTFSQSEYLRSVLISLTCAHFSFFLWS